MEEIVDSLPEKFQSPRSGQICSNPDYVSEKANDEEFQSPRSGQICSNDFTIATLSEIVDCFNPLDRVKFVQILDDTVKLGLIA